LPSWSSLTEEAKLAAVNATPAVRVDVYRVRLVNDEAVEGVFGARVSGFGAELHLVGVTVRGAPLSGVLADRGGTVTLEDCMVADCKQNGIFGFEMCGLSVKNCSVKNCGSFCVSISVISIGTARALVSHSVFSADKDNSAIVLRTRSKPCNLDLQILDNTISNCWTGIIHWPRYADDDDDDEARKRRAQE
jgi:hypothetical protein